MRRDATPKSKLQILRVLIGWIEELTIRIAERTSVILLFDLQGLSRASIVGSRLSWVRCSEWRLTGKGRRCTPMPLEQGRSLASRDSMWPS